MTPRSAARLSTKDYTAQNTWNLETGMLYSVYSVHLFFSPLYREVPSLNWCVSFLQAECLREQGWGGAQRSFGERSRARDDSSSRGSSAPLRAARDGDGSGSQDDIVYVSVCFLASNYACEPLRVWLCHVAPLGAGVKPHPPLFPLGKYQGCSKERAPGTAGYGWP